MSLAESTRAYTPTLGPACLLPRVGRRARGQDLDQRLRVALLPLVAHAPESRPRIVVPGVESKDNIADILTKLYDSPSHFEYLASKLRSWDAAT